MNYSRYVIASRPWSFTASSLPLLYLSLSTGHGLLQPLFTLTTIQAASNYLNSYSDRHTDDGKGDRTLYDHITPLESLKLSAVFYCSSFIPYLINTATTNIIIIHLTGLTLSILYSSPPFYLKHRLLGDLTIYVTFHYLILKYYSELYNENDDMNADITADITGLSLLTIGILHGNNMRDREVDYKNGIRTVANFLPTGMGGIYFAGLVGGPFLIEVKVRQICIICHFVIQKRCILTPPPRGALSDSVGHGIFRVACVRGRLEFEDKASRQGLEER